MARCECGSWSVGSNKHAYYCPMEEGFNSNVYQKIFYESFRSPYLTLAYLMTNGRDPKIEFQKIKDEYPDDILMTSDSSGIYIIMWKNGSYVYVASSSEETIKQIGPDITYIEECWGIDDHIKDVISPNTKRYVEKVNPYSKEVI